MAYFIRNKHKNFFTESIGGFIETTANIITKSIDYIFFGFETGIDASVTAGDDSKPISFYISSPSNWYKFWEIKMGIKVNIFDFHISVSNDLFGYDVSCGYKNSSAGFRVGLDRISASLTHEKDGVSSYVEGYINTIPTALAIAAVAAVIIAPESIPVVGGAIAALLAAF